MRIGMIRTPCGYHHSILMGNRPPSNLTGRTRMPTRHHRPHALPSPYHRPWARAVQGRRATRIGTGDTRMCAWQRRACLAPCGLCCAAAGTHGLLHIQAARGWLALRLLASPRPPCPFAPPRRLYNRRGAPGPSAPRAAARGRCAHARACHYHEGTAALARGA